VDIALGGPPMTSLAARLKYCAALLLLAATVCPLGGCPSYGQTPDFLIFRELVPGLLSRTRYDFDDSRHPIKILDLLVGPGKISASYKLTAGGALFDVQGGQATLTVDGKRRPVEPGVIVPLAQNQTITVDNSRAPRPLVVRLVVISVK